MLENNILSLKGLGIRVSNYFLPLISLPSQFMCVLPILEQCLGSLQRKKNNKKKNHKPKTQVLLPVSYAEMQSNCSSSEIDAFPPFITGTPQYKNSIWKFREVLHSVVLRFNRVTQWISETSA